MKKFIKNTVNSIRANAIGLYALFGDVVMPTLNQRIKDMFNYAGALGG